MRLTSEITGEDGSLNCLQTIFVQLAIDWMQRLVITEFIFRCVRGNKTSNLFAAD